MRKLLLLIVAALALTSIKAQPDTTQKIIEGRVNDATQQQKPYVILISVDGFRHDYAKKHGAKHLLQLAANGVMAESMIPSYPSLTFPNHYTIVTGMYPSHHGLVDNYFYSPVKKKFYSMKNPATYKDGSWYGGTPLWVLAEQQQMLTAAFYWVGSEADIKGIHPTYYYSYNEKIPLEKRMDVVIDWLTLPEEKRPHLICFYFPEVDHAGHDYGPDSPQIRDAVRKIDKAIKTLSERVMATGLPVNFIFVGDHGMTSVDTAATLQIPDVVDSSRFFIPRGSQLVGLYARDREDINLTYQQLKMQEKGYNVYLKENVPAALRYGKDDDKYGVIGDILLIPKWPKLFYRRGAKPDPGAHGYDPNKVRDMHTVFYAWGQNFKQGLQVPSFENVHVYPVVARILGLPYDEAIDGKPGIANLICR